MGAGGRARGGRRAEGTARGERRGAGARAHATPHGGGAASSRELRPPRAPLGQWRDGGGMGPEAHTRRVGRVGGRPEGA